ncbi:MAG TPA: hypothetical protein VIM43_05570 [Rugosibacter sp.]
MATVDTGVMAGATNAWAREASVCNSESSADESMDVGDVSEPTDASDDPAVMRAIAAGSVSFFRAELSANFSSLAELAEGFSARDFSVAAKDAGVLAVMLASVVSSELGRDASARLGVCIEAATAFEVIGSSDIFFLKP